VVELNVSSGEDELVFAYDVVRTGEPAATDLGRDDCVRAIAGEEKPSAISVTSGCFQAYARWRVPLTIRVTEARVGGGYPEIAVLEFQALELGKSVIAVMEAALRLAAEGKRNFVISDVTKKVREMRLDPQLSAAATLDTTAKGRRPRARRQASTAVAVTV
jgi:hypothetical protein